MVENNILCQYFCPPGSLVSKLMQNIRFYQGMLYRVKNDRKVIEIATILTISSSEQEGNLEQERVGKFKINNIVALVFQNSKDKRAENSKFFMSIFILFSC